MPYGQELNLPLLGDHQLENARTALTCIMELENKGYQFSLESIQKGIETLNWPGRFEILNRDPLLIIDGAHNRDSFRKLERTMAEYLQGKEKILIFGASEDKEVELMLKIIRPQVDLLVITQAAHPRALHGCEIQDRAMRLGMRNRVTGSVEEALEYALNQYQHNSAILAAGRFLSPGLLKKSGRTEGKGIMKQPVSGMFGQDDVNASLYQRPDELYQIENARVDQNGCFIRPAVVFHDVVVLPHMVTPVFIQPGPNLEAILAAQKEKQTLITLNPKEQEDEESLTFEEMGLEVAAGSVLELPDKNYSALIQGRNRIEIVDILQENPYLLVKARLLEDSGVLMDSALKGRGKTTRSLFEQVVQYDRSIPDEAHFFSINITDPGWLADMVATAISPEIEQRKEIIHLVDVRERLIYVNRLLAEELDVLHIEDEIQSRVQNEVDRSQREFYLREQIKAIQVELGEGDIWEQEIQDYNRKLSETELRMPFGKY
jgi:ATP-dependent Lon protease